jgi:hypothetical protein
LCGATQVEKGDTLYKPGEKAREAFIISSGVDGNDCEVLLTEDEKRDVTLRNGDMVGVNALTFESKHGLRTNTATVTAPGDLMLIPRHVVIEIDEKYPDAGVRHTVESYIEYRNEQKRLRATSELSRSTKAEWTPPKVEPEPSCEERLSKIEEEMGEMKDLLKQLVAQNTGSGATLVGSGRAGRPSR